MGLLDDQVGLIGPTNYYYGKPTIVWAAGAMLKYRPKDEYIILGGGDTENSWKTALQVDALIGSVMLIKRNFFEKIDFFDEKFFLCWEEFYLCARAREVGFKCLFVPEAKLWHKVGSSLGKPEEPLRIYFNIRNKMLWTKKPSEASDKSTASGSLPRIYSDHMASICLAGDRYSTCKKIAVGNLQLDKNHHAQYF